MSREISLPPIDDFNGWADVYFYEWGVNVIPAPTIDKGKDEKDRVSSWIKGGWQDYQIRAMTEEEHENFKGNGDHTSRKGLAVVSGRVWRGPNKGLWLTFIDCDNEIAIASILGMFGYESLEEMSKDFVVEQHRKDAPNKAHIYLYSKVPLSQLPSLATKGNGKFGDKIKGNTMPGLEIKSEKSGLAFACPSFHAGGERYEILQGGTAIPKMVLEEDEVVEIESKIEEVFIEYGISYIENDGKIPMSTLLNPNFRIKAGNNRHNAVLRVSTFFLLRSPTDRWEALEKTKKWNNEHCEPPLSEDKYTDLPRTFEWAEKYVKRIKEKQHEEKGENKESKKEQAIKTTTKLVDDQEVFWFKDEYQTAYVRIKIDNHYEVMHVDKKSRIFRLFITKLYYDYSGGATLKTDELLEVIRALEAKAMFSGNVRKLHLRKAWLVKDIDAITFEETVDRSVCFYDMCSPYWTCIMVDGNNESWQLLPHHPENIIFYRYQQRPQVIPKRKGDYADNILDQWLTKMHVINESDRLLFKVWIVAIFIPDQPHPMLIPHGPPGGGKSALCKQVGFTFDPYAGEPLMLPTKKEEAAQHAHHRALLIYDNIEYDIPKWLSDLLCQLITSANVSKRQLYTDDSDFAYVLMRSVVLNGLQTPKLKSDALDRTIKLHFDRIEDIDRKMQSEINDWFKEVLPEILGKIFDTLARSLKIYPIVKLEKLPLMADFAVRGVSIARALATTGKVASEMEQEFLDAYNEVMERQNIDIVESDSVAQAVIKWHNDILKAGKDEDSQKYLKDGKIGYSPGTLLAKLTLRGQQMGFDVKDKDWPKKPFIFVQRLKPLTPDIKHGYKIDVYITRDTKGEFTGKNSSWIWISEVGREEEKGGDSARTDITVTDSNNCSREEKNNYRKNASTASPAPPRQNSCSNSDQNGSGNENVSLQQTSTNVALETSSKAVNTNDIGGGTVEAKENTASSKMAENHAQILKSGGVEAVEALSKKQFNFPSKTSKGDSYSAITLCKEDSVAVDLEWDNRLGAEDRLLQFNFKDYCGKKWVLNAKRDFNDSEADLLEAAVDTVRNYRVVYTYFEKGATLGFGIWDKRAKAVGKISPIFMGWRKDGSDSRIDLVNKKGFQIIDIDIGQVYEQPAIQNWSGNIYASNELGVVAQAVLKRGKTEGVKGKDFPTLPLETQIEYGLQDADLTFDLAANESFLILEILDYLANFVDIPLEEVCNSSPNAWWESYYQNVMHVEPSPNAIKKNVGEKYVGGDVAKVEEVKEYRNIVVLDFKQQYPSLAKAKNVSFDTVNCIHLDCANDCKAKIITGKPEIDAKGYYTCRKEKGSYPKALEVLTELRDNYKAEYKKAFAAGDTEKAHEFDVRQNTMKIVSNTGYGVFGESHFRYGDVRTAEIITSLGRTKVAKLKELIESDKFPNLRNIYRDTDSAFIIGIEERLSRDNPTVKKILEIANKPEEEGGLGIPLEFDKWYSKVLIYAAKNYMGVNGDTGKLVVKGLVGKKRNQCDLVKEAFEEVKEFWMNDVENATIEAHIKPIIASLDNKTVNIEKLQERSKINQDPITGYLDTPKRPEKVLGVKHGKRINESIVFWHKANRSKDNDYFFTEDQAEIDYAHYKEPLRTALKPILTVRGYSAE